MTEQDWLDIYNLIQTAPIRFDQAERALELRKKIEQEIEKAKEQEQDA